MLAMQMQTRPSTYYVLHADTNGMCPHELRSAAAMLQAEQREAEADQAVAEAAGRIPELAANWEMLHCFMAQMEIDIKANKLDEWKAMENRAAHKIIQRCGHWTQRTDFTKEQLKIIDRFDTTCRQAFFV